MQLIKQTTDGTLCHKGRYRDASHVDSDRYTITVVERGPGLVSISTVGFTSAQAVRPNGVPQIWGPTFRKAFFCSSGYFPASLFIATPMEGRRRTVESKRERRKGSQGPGPTFVPNRDSTFLNPAQ